MEKRGRGKGEGEGRRGKGMEGIEIHSTLSISLSRKEVRRDVNANSDVI